MENVVADLRSTKPERKQSSEGPELSSTSPRTRRLPTWTQLCLVLKAELYTLLEARRRRMVKEVLGEEEGCCGGGKCVNVAA